ncbi:MAG: hypothetical protein RIC55_05625 [Pirellulaceae bacterium]
MNEHDDGNPYRSPLAAPREETREPSPPAPPSSRREVLSLVGNFLLWQAVLWLGVQFGWNIVLMVVAAASFCGGMFLMGAATMELFSFRRRLRYVVVWALAVATVVLMIVQLPGDLRIYAAEFAALTILAALLLSGIGSLVKFLLGRS